MRRGDVFQRIKGYSQHTEREDFVFSTYEKNEVLSKKRLYTLFNQLREIVKTKHSDFDETKSLYSLRHFWITIRILADLMSTISQKYQAPVSSKYRNTMMRQQVLLPVKK